MRLLNFYVIISSLQLSELRLPRQRLFAIMRGIQYFYLMHAIKLNENSPSLSKSDGLTSKVYLRIYYSLRMRGCYLRTALHGLSFARSLPLLHVQCHMDCRYTSAFLLKILRRYLVHPEYASHSLP